MPRFPPENPAASPLRIERTFARVEEAEGHRDAARRRLVASSSPSIRQSIGRLMIRIGERVAAEPSPSLARQV